METKITPPRNQNFGSSIVNAKLGGVVNIPKEETKVMPVNIPRGNPPPAKYDKDPYREPLE